MSSLMRSRGSSGKEFESSEPTVILDKAQQESLINELEAEATRAAAVWRAVFGGGSVIIGLYFLALSATVFTSPAGSTDFWRGAIHREFYEVTSPARLALLDGATGFAALVGGVAAMYPSRSTRGRGEKSAHWARVATFVVAAVAGCGAALGWAAALCAGKAGAPGIPRVSMRHMLWLPALSALAPVSCAYCYSQLEGTVVDARALRGHMYEHKRA